MKKFLAVLFLILFQGLSAQVQFEARVSRQSIGINERLRIDFMMNDDGDNFTPPSFEGFRVVGGPSQQVSQSWVNGRSSFNKSYIYFLLPMQKGTLTIKSATIEIRGETYKTEPIKITVGNAVKEEQDPSSPNYVPNIDGVHIVAEVSKENPYLNEPITVVYKLYVSHNVSVRNWRETSSPKFNDFWSQNIEIKDLVVENGKYKGEDYRYVILKKAVLYPQKAGKLTIEPLSLDVVMEVPTNRRDIFGRPQLVAANKTVSSGSRVIRVKDLPEAGKPDDFTGAVGKFTFAAKPTKTELKHGESLDLEVSVSGNGNLKLFTLPKPIVPSALEMYDPVHSENVNTPLSGMQGKITDKYTLIPQYKGNYPVKAMSFSYFDPSAGRYKTLTSPEIMVKVLDGPTGPEPVASAEEGIGKQTVQKNVEFANIKLKTKLVSVKKATFFGTNLYYALLALPFILIPIIIFIRRRKEARDGDIAGNKRRMSNRLAKKYLSQAKKQINNKEPFYIALERALHNFLKAKLHIETSDMSKEIITEILLERGAKPETVKDFIDLTENCEFARYAPFSSVAIKQDYEKAVTVISELEKQI